MLGNPSLDYESPKRHRETCAAAAKWSQTPFVVDGIHAYVDDVDAHFGCSRSTSATSYRRNGALSEPSVASEDVGGASRCAGS